PSSTPTVKPTTGDKWWNQSPTSHPTEDPTSIPTAQPTIGTEDPTSVPTAVPTTIAQGLNAPTFPPTSQPSSTPTGKPTTGDIWWSGGARQTSRSAHAQAQTQTEALSRDKQQHVMAQAPQSPPLPVRRSWWSLFFPYAASPRPRPRPMHRTLAEREQLRRGEV
ncbi:hypothetical protein B484DRAFT_439510, partial [Ochromonadaceae sp. CCMP2298]